MALAPRTCRRLRDRHIARASQRVLSRVVFRFFRQRPIFQSPGRGNSSRPYYNRVVFSFSSSSIHSVSRRTRVLSASCRTS